MLRALPAAALEEGFDGAAWAAAVREADSTAALRRLLGEVRGRLFCWCIGQQQLEGDLSIRAECMVHWAAMEGLEGLACLPAAHLSASPLPICNSSTLIGTQLQLINSHRHPFATHQLSLQRFMLHSRPAAGGVGGR